MIDPSLHDCIRGGIDVTPWMTGPPPAKGQYQRYPGRFIYNLIRSRYLEDKNMDILEMFSGGSDLSNFGFKATTTDIRSETGCDIVAPFDNLPVVDNWYGMVIADPPYNKGFANKWINHQKYLPKPKHVLKEAARVVRPGGLILILHIIIIPAYKEFNVKRIALHPIFAGPNNAIRILNVLQKK